MIGSLRRRRGVIIAFILGLLLASAGTATAARLITSKDIKNGTIRSKDLSKPVRKKLNAPGQQGPQGEQGPKGEQGPPGPSWATAGSAGPNSTGNVADLTGFTQQGFPQGFRTPDAGPVLAASSQQMRFECIGPADPNNQCSFTYALAIDGVPLRGSVFGRSAQAQPEFSNSPQDLTIFGTLESLPAGEHDLRLYTKVTTKGNATPSVSVSSWSFSVQRVGSVG
jgi:hypothetical protein